MTLTVGTRVRTLIDLTSVDWEPERPDIPAGALGTIDYVHFSHRDPNVPTGYGVMLDGSVDLLSAWIDTRDIEAL